MVGELLKRKREELGRDLRDISNNLKIKYDYLKALEDGELEKLPAGVYIRGYIQEYAKLLNMDPEPLIEAYKQHPIHAPQEKNEAPELKDLHPKRPKLGYVLIPLLFVVLIMIVSIRLLTGTKDKSAPIAPAVAAKGENSPKPVAPELTLQVLAADTTWLFVTIDKSDSKEMLMKPGDSITWHAKKGFFLKIGNAAGVRLVFNGKEVGKLGEKGQVIKLNLPDVKA